MNLLGAAQGLLLAFALVAMPREEVGFNSKSTFNAAFKKHAGTTPSDFRMKAEVLESA